MLKCHITSVGRAAGVFNIMGDIAMISSILIDLRLWLIRKLIGKSITCLANVDVDFTTKEFIAARNTVGSIWLNLGLGSVEEPVTLEQEYN